ncbi:MAG: AAA family ATPase [Alphaproteobacteria bacterium]|nr:AAA family ATPase [Alphaproteobacteria bacterium]
MLIERENEVQTLHQVLSQVPDNGGRVLVLYGEAGIGKSSLIHAFLSNLSNSEKVAFGMCDPLNTPRPLGPVRDIARDILGSHPEAEIPLTESLMERLTASENIHVIVLEDMHWADQASLDWLKYFCRRIALIPAMLIVSFRDAEIDAAHPLRSALGVIPGDRTQRLHLSPLSRDGVAAFDLPPNMSADQLYDITDGNPFFVSEILNNADDVETVPDSIRDAVNARVNQLSPSLQSLLEASSCFPGDIEPKFLQPIIDRPVKDELAVAERLGLLVHGVNGFRFRHELARLATQMRLSETERQAIHGQLLDALLAHNALGPLLADIVHHAEGAREVETLLCFAPMAAKEAARMGAHREAAQYLFAAMKHAEDAEPGVAAEIYEMWAYEAGLALTIDDDVIDARKRAVSLWKKLGQMDRVGENLRWLSRLHWYRGEPEQAQAYLEEAIETLQGIPSEAAAMAFGLRAQFHMLRDEMEAAQEWGKKALAIAETVDAPEVKAHALNTIGAAKLFRGDLTGETLLRESLALSLEYDFHEQAARAYTNLAECLIELGEIERAEPFLDEGVTFDIAHDLDSWTYYLVGRKAQLRFEQHRYTEAVDIAKGVLSRQNQTVLMQLPAKIVLARSLLRLGDSAARERLEDAFHDASQIGELQYIAVVRTAFIEAAVLWGQSDLARPHIKEIEKLSFSSLSPRKWADFVFWADRVDDGLSGEYSDNLPEAFRLDHQGEFEAAAKALRSQELKYLAATSLCRSQAKGALATADRWYEEIGALAGRKYIRSTFDVSSQGLPGLTRGQYKAARRHPYSLTSKEQIVLGLIIEGASNTRIAEHLSRSKRTIENHVSSILRKFGVSNRVELILRAQAEPWILDQGQSGSGLAGGDRHQLEPGSGSDT